MSIQFVGVTLVAFALFALASDVGAAQAAPRVLTDFDAASPVSWYTVNDGVMGGRSQGGFQVNDGILVFAGSTNTNGGGFSSIRTRRSAFDLTGQDGVRLRVKADGRRYTFRLTAGSAGRRRAASYWADFETRNDGTWQVVDVPFSRFTPRWRGRLLKGMTLDVSKIDSLGLMIYDKLDGAFRMEVDWIQAYRTQAATTTNSSSFSMSSYRGTRRPLLVFAPRQDDARLAQQLESIERTRSEFAARDMTLIVLLTNGQSTAGATPLKTWDAGALRATYGVKDGAFAVRLVGKDGGVKHASAEAVNLSKIYALIDSMPMRQREMESARGR